MSPQTLFFFFSIVLAIRGPLAIPYEFEDQLFHFFKKPVGILIRNCIDSVDCFGDS